MRDLISAEPFSPIEHSVRNAVSELMNTKLPVTIISEANLQGSLSVAPIEAHCWNQISNIGGGWEAISQMEWKTA